MAAKLTESQAKLLRRAHEEGPVVIADESDASTDAAALEKAGLMRSIKVAQSRGGPYYVLSGAGVVALQAAPAPRLT